MMPAAEHAGCAWPHEILSAESEARLTVALSRHRGWVRGLARMLSRHDRFLRRELEQVALLELWRLGWETLDREAEAVLRSIVIGRMLNARRAERRALLGARRVRVSGLNN